MNIKEILRGGVHLILLVKDWEQWLVLVSTGIKHWHLQNARNLSAS
jgi:hypothetical protein